MDLLPKDVFISLIFKKKLDNNPFSPLSVDYLLATTISPLGLTCFNPIFE